MAIDKELVDRRRAEYKRPEQIVGETGLLKQLTKAVLERALEAEMTGRIPPVAPQRLVRQAKTFAYCLARRTIPSAIRPDTSASPTVVLICCLWLLPSRGHQLARRLQFPAGEDRACRTEIG